MPCAKALPYLSGKRPPGEPNHNQATTGGRLRPSARSSCGHVIAAPPSSVMNSRRLIVTPRGQNTRTASSHSRPGLGTGRGGCGLRPIVLAANVGFGSHDRVKTGKTQNCKMVSGLPPKADLPPDLRAIQI